MAARPEADPLDALPPGERALVVDIVAIFLGDAINPAQPGDREPGSPSAEERPNEAA